MSITKIEHNNAKWLGDDGEIVVELPREQEEDGNGSDGDNGGGGGEHESGGTNATGNGKGKGKAKAKARRFTAVRVDDVVWCGGCVGGGVYVGWRGVEL